jgi:hypothetical protein
MIGHNPPRNVPKQDDRNVDRHRIINTITKDTHPPKLPTQDDEVVDLSYSPKKIQKFSVIDVEAGDISGSPKQLTSKIFGSVARKVQRQSEKAIEETGSPVQHGKVVLDDQMGHGADNVHDEVSNTKRKFDSSSEIGSVPKKVKVRGKSGDGHTEVSIVDTKRKEPNSTDNYLELLDKFQQASPSQKKFVYHRLFPHAMKFFTDNTASKNITRPDLYCVLGMFEEHYSKHGFFSNGHMEFIKQYDNDQLSEENSSETSARGNSTIAELQAANIESSTDTLPPPMIVKKTTTAELSEENSSDKTACGNSTTRAELLAANIEFTSTADINLDGVELHLPVGEDTTMLPTTLFEIKKSSTDTIPLTMMVHKNTTAELGELLSISDISSKKDKMPGDDESISSNENIPMAFFFTNSLSVQAGVDAGCLRCSQLVSNGMSDLKHKFNCPSKLQSAYAKFPEATIGTQNSTVADCSTVAECNSRATLHEGSIVAEHKKDSLLPPQQHKKVSFHQRSKYCLPCFKQNSVIEVSSTVNMLITKMYNCVNDSANLGSMGKFNVPLKSVFEQSIMYNDRYMLVEFLNDCNGVTSFHPLSRVDMMKVGIYFSS